MSVALYAAATFPLIDKDNPGTSAIPFGHVNFGQIWMQLFCNFSKGEAP